MNANKGKNGLACKEVSEAYLFQSAKDADVSFVLGPPINSRCHLVLARFHKPKTIPRDQSLDLVGKKGFKCQQKGSSNGLTRYDKTFLKFLSTPGNFPHPARNIAILQGDMKWECLYISPNNIDNQAKINEWNGGNSTGKIKLARQAKWNHMHPDCPIYSNHLFSQSNGFILLLLLVVAFSFPKCYCQNTLLYWNSQNSSSRLLILLKHYNKHQLCHK